MGFNEEAKLVISKDYFESLERLWLYGIHPLVSFWLGWRHGVRALEGRVLTEEYLPSQESHEDRTAHPCSRSLETDRSDRWISSRPAILDSRSRLITPNSLSILNDADVKSVKTLPKPKFERVRGACAQHQIGVPRSLANDRRRRAPTCALPR